MKPNQRLHVSGRGISVAYKTSSIASLFMALGCQPDAPNGEGERCSNQECHIELELVATISDSAQLGILPDGFLFLEQGPGGILVTGSRMGSEVVKFDSAGRLIDIVGRRGRGPGEFRSVRKPMFGTGDSLHVPDMIGRMSVFAPDGSLARIVPFQYMPELILPDGSYIVTRQLHAPENGYPIHRLDSRGWVLNSFGSDTVHRDLTKGLLTNLKVSLSSDGTIWAVAPGIYVIERWEPSTGQRVQRAEVASTWFESSDVWRDDERIRPQPVIEGIWETDSTLVWVLIRASDTDWRAPANANIERVMPDAEYNALFDWVIEAIDPRTARVLASKRIANVLWYRGPAPLLLSPVDSDSLVAFEVLRATLRIDHGGPRAR